MCDDIVHSLKKKNIFKLPELCVTHNGIADLRFLFYPFILGHTRSKALMVC